MDIIQGEKCQNLQENNLYRTQNKNSLGTTKSNFESRPIMKANRDHHKVSHIFFLQLVTKTYAKSKSCNVLTAYLIKVDKERISYSLQDISSNMWKILP